MTTRKPQILFVCTGNIFRSLSAEFAMRAADKGGAYDFSSAGTRTRFARPLRDDVLGSISKHIGQDASAHQSRPLDEEILRKADLVVAMDLDHQRHLRDHFNIKAPLFLQISRGVQLGLPDLPDVVPDFRNQPEESARFVDYMVGRIKGEAPSFMKNLPRYLAARGVAPRPQP